MPRGDGWILLRMAANPRAGLPLVPGQRIFFVDTPPGGYRMRVQVQKWGNSLALRIPKSVAQDAGVRAGTIMDVGVARGKLVAVPVAPTPMPLKSLLRRVTSRNVHGEIETGERQGRESW